jgi:hypothetical protein
MQHFKRIRAVLFCAAALAAGVAFAQDDAPAPGGIGNSDQDESAYDPRDFNGLWSRLPSQYDLPPCPECRDPATWPGYGFFGDTPPMTA